jgi:hypothetical protein
VAEHTLIYFIQLSLVEYVNILPGDALATDFLKIIINKRYSQQVYRYHLLFVYNNATAKYLEVVRKSKKDMENAVINID